MADRTEETGEYESSEESVASGEESDDGEIYYPGMLADLNEQVVEYQEELFQRELFGVCESGDTAVG